MSYSVTDSNLCNEIQMTLIETPNSGVSYGSGLYTSAEVAARLNYRLRDFYKRTKIVTKRDATNYAANANQREQNLPLDCIDVIRVAYPDTNGSVVALMPESIGATDMLVNDLWDSNAAVDQPGSYSLDNAGVKQLSFLPPPATARTVDFVYVPQPTTLASTPDTTLIECPDDFTPYLKWGVLADLFGKSGETYDPVRAGICNQLYELGVQMARLMVSREE